jgi:carboxyl-terminal processing protease
MAILVDKGTASAAEIISGAVQDTKAGKLFGTTTYGKGCVQNIYKLTNDTAIKLTMAKYYTPSGRSIDKVGITPDVEIAPDDPTGKNQLSAAENYVREEISK